MLRVRIQVSQLLLQRLDFSEVSSSGYNQTKKEHHLQGASTESVLATGLAELQCLDLPT